MDLRLERPGEKSDSFQRSELDMGVGVVDESLSL
jgi:hypothetical protein